MNYKYIEAVMYAFVGNLLYYDHDDETIEEVIRRGELTQAQVVALFSRELRRALAGEEE